MDTIKCGRKTFDLTDGDTVMDNGACLQLITRSIRSGFNSVSPRVSKTELAKFKKLSVKQNNNHNYGESVTLWTYIADNTRKQETK